MPLKTIGISLKGMSLLLYGIGFGFACTVLLGLQMIVTGEMDESFLSTVDSSLLLPNLLLSILVGTGEEVLFRGFFYNDPADKQYIGCRFHLELLSNYF